MADFQIPTLAHFAVDDVLVVQPKFQLLQLVFGRAHDQLPQTLSLAPASDSLRHRRRHRHGKYPHHRPLQNQARPFDRARVLIL